MTLQVSISCHHEQQEVFIVLLNEAKQPLGKKSQQKIATDNAAIFLRPYLLLKLVYFLELIEPKAPLWAHGCCGAQDKYLNTIQYKIKMLRRKRKIIAVDNKNS